MNTLSVLAGTLLQDDGGSFVAIMLSLLGTICWFGLMIVIIAGYWKTFEKANKPGWASLIPFYNIYVMLEIIGRPGWWLILFFIPVVNVVVLIMLSIDMAKSFGKDTFYGVLMLWLLMPIGYLMLGFGDAEYQGPANVI